jgi:probable rRNA maturation factor
MRRWWKKDDETKVAVIAIVADDQYQELISERDLSKAVEATLHLSGVSDAPSLSIRITSDSEIQEMNLRYREINKATDVLAFGGDFQDPDLESRYLGDVVISYPQAETQAYKRGHQPGEELQLLVIHGVLHLLGYDHGSEDEKNKMWPLQEKILARVGVSIQVEDPQGS